MHVVSDAMLRAHAERWRTPSFLQPYASTTRLCKQRLAALAEAVGIRHAAARTVCSRRKPWPAYNWSAYGPDSGPRGRVRSAPAGRRRSLLIPPVRLSTCLVSWCGRRAPGETQGGATEASE